MRVPIAISGPLITAIMLLAAAPNAHGSIGLVVSEPFGKFGTMLPVGHAGIYLDHLCAASPTELRPCAPGERGVVISRYHDLKQSQLDWLAVPALPFFYGVEDAGDVPAFVTPQLESELRENYRQAHLAEVVSDRTDRNGNARPPKYGDWAEGIGATFDRRVFVYMIDTTPEQDAAILALLHGDANHRAYSLRRRNCADFADRLLNVVLPGVIHRRVFGDFDLMTPKQLARSVDSYGRAHPEVNLRVLELPQLPGTLRRSRPIRGSAETFVKTKRYLAALLILQPEALLADWIDYEASDKWTLGLDAFSIQPSDWQTMSVPSPQPALSAAGCSNYSLPSSRSTASSTASPAIGLRAK